MLFSIVRFFWRLLVVGFPPEVPDCVHEFAPWEDKERATVRYIDKEFLPYTEVTVEILPQERRCKKCNIIQTQKIEISRRCNEL
jgi:hypothetical protein